jgi:hypothetical protein
LVGAGVIASAVVVVTALPESLLGGDPLRLGDHRGEVRLGGFVILLGLGIGIVTPFVLG